MTTQKYLIEAMDGEGRWYILGSCERSGAAQAHLRSYRRLSAKTPLRVVENPSRVLVVLDDPRPLH